MTPVGEPDLSLSINPGNTAVSSGGARAGIHARQLVLLRLDRLQSEPPETETSSDDLEWRWSYWVPRPDQRGAYFIELRITDDNRRPLDVVRTESFRIV